MGTVFILYIYIFLINTVFSVCPENEVEAKCPTGCPSDSCPTEPRRMQHCPKITSDICRPSTCKCRFNYSRAKNGTCIPTVNCPPFRCRHPHEEYNPCPPLCPSDDCSQATPNGKCPLLGRIGIVVPCQPDCRCKKNYWRKNGVCVPYRRCNKDNLRTSFAHAAASGKYVSTTTYTDTGSNDGVTRAYSYSHASSS